MDILIYRFVYLYLIEKLSQERTINSVYHLLQGKKSVQTIQDAHLFNIEDFYAIDKKLTKNDFKNVLIQLEKDALIKKEEATKFVLTEQGHLWYSRHHEFKDKLHFNGWSHQKMANVFFMRLQLIVQVWTNKYKNNMKYIPVIEDSTVRQWVKKIFQLTQDKTEKYLSSLYEELFVILKLFEAQSASIFVKQLSAYQHTGLTINQLAYEYHLNPVEIAFETENVIHCILNQVLSRPSDYPVLNLLSYQDEPTQEAKLNESTMKTKALFDQGYSIDQIIRMRRLKQSTIHDHLIEIAYSSKVFPFHLFFTQADYQMVSEIIDQIQSYQLKKIKDLIKEALTYFQIRLIIAAIHHNK